MKHPPAIPRIYFKDGISQTLLGTCGVCIQTHIKVVKHGHDTSFGGVRSLSCRKKRSCSASNASLHFAIFSKTRPTALRRCRQSLRGQGIRPAIDDERVGPRTYGRVGLSLKLFGVVHRPVLITNCVAPTRNNSFAVMAVFSCTRLRPMNVPLVLRKSQRNWSPFSLTIFA